MFGPQVDIDARNHALEAYPEECCGVVIDGSYVRLKNVADNPQLAFKIARFEPSFQAVLHSHPEDTVVPKFYGPSAADMRGQASSGLPWGVISTNGRNATPVVWFGDQVPVAPLTQRPFIHGVFDCYSLVRDYLFLERGVRIYNQPRDHEWWNHSDDYLNPGNFVKYGFMEHPLAELRVGDGIVMCVGAGRIKKMNHCAIYVGNGLILHHLFNRPSRRDNLGPWLKMCYKSALRYEGPAE